MRNVFELMVRDVRHATQSVMAWMVVFGLVIIPSLFAWFNVLASWDPFANTGNLKVAVANSDAGYQSDVVPIPINVGEQVLSQLRANDDLDWIITSEPGRAPVPWSWPRSGGRRRCSRQRRAPCTRG